MAVSGVSWADALSAVSSIAVPILLAVFGFIFNRRLRTVEQLQWQTQELIKARFESYRKLAPPLNDLMCYFTFAGRWKELTPPQVIELKRDLDREFYCTAPLFATTVTEKYDLL